MNALGPLARAAGNAIVEAAENAVDAAVVDTVKRAGEAVEHQAVEIAQAIENDVVYYGDQIIQSVEHAFAPNDMSMVTEQPSDIMLIDNNISGRRRPNPPEKLPFKQKKPRLRKEKSTFTLIPAARTRLVHSDRSYPEDEPQPVAAPIPFEVPDVVAVERIAQRIRSGAISQLARYSSYLPPPRGRSKMSDYVTRRGVKRMIGEHAQFVDKYTHIQDQGGVYLGYVTGGNIPTVRYGYVERGNMIFGSKTEWEAWATIVNNNSPTKTAGHNESVNYKYRTRRRKYTFLFHNPVNEVVRATFGWIKCKEDGATTHTPAIVWPLEYAQKVDVSGTAFDTNFLEYPTKYKIFNDYFEILDKVKVLFQPGQTMKWKTKCRPSILSETDAPDEAHRQAHTYFLMWELKGVPTHQNGGGTQTNQVSYSPAALDCIYHESLEMARTSAAGDLIHVQSNLPEVTAGKSQVDTGAFDYATN